MRTFSVVLNERDDEVASRIAEAYPDHYQISEVSFLVADDALTDTVATNVGIKGENKVDGARGVVFKLNHTYSGYTSRSLWDWLEKAEEHG